MSLEVLSWNIEDGLGKDEKLARSIIERITDLSPSVAVFPEAFHTDTHPYRVELIKEEFDVAGYSVLTGAYDDADDRRDRHSLLAIVKSELATPYKTHRMLRLARRNVLELWAHDPVSGVETRFVGLHLDDRQEATRQQQIGALLSTYDIIDPTILVGDFNSVHRVASKDKKLYLAHGINALTHLGLPADEPGYSPTRTSKIGKLRDKAGRVGSLGKRLHQMADGGTMEMLADAGFSDADWPNLRPTMPASAPFVQLDHIMLSPGTQALSFGVLPRHEGADHRAISADVAVGY